MDFFSGSMRNSHQKATIFGGSMKELSPFLGAVLRKHVSHPSRQLHPSFQSQSPTPSHRATSFGSVFIGQLVCDSQVRIAVHPACRWVLVSRLPSPQSKVLGQWLRCVSILLLTIPFLGFLLRIGILSFHLGRKRTIFGLV
jgi:hypothetical protein